MASKLYQLTLDHHSLVCSMQYHSRTFCLFSRLLQQEKIDNVVLKCAEILYNVLKCAETLYNDRST